jgi:hypothetical protein
MTLFFKKKNLNQFTDIFVGKRQTIEQREQIN